jgi:hypothetical protein
VQLLEHTLDQAHVLVERLGLDLVADNDAVVHGMLPCSLADRAGRGGPIRTS